MLDPKIRRANKRAACENAHAAGLPSLFVDRLRLQVGFQEPQIFVQFPRELREQVHGDGIA